MAGVPGELHTDVQPPLAVPLQHFLVALGLLVAGVGVALGTALGVVPGRGHIASLHLLLVGWVGLTILGAMTQFIPVWSGVHLYSRRLAVVQLWLTATGVAGLAVAFVLLAPWTFVPAAILLVAGIWTFVYNIARTLRAVTSWDVTERHFALALAFFAVLAPLGALLALEFRWSLLAAVPVSRPEVVGAHATLAVFGAVLTTVLGALYQLGTMFTQTELHGVDLTLRRVESVAYPTGVVLLAIGRLFGTVLVAQVGGVLVVVGLLSVSWILVRRLSETKVEWSPMLSRYAVLTGAIPLWAVGALVTWVEDPLSRSVLLGGPGGTALLVFGIIGFVVFGTLYHVVPFLVWLHVYSDRLGLEPVPMIDDLYDGRLAVVDFWALALGTGLLVGSALTTIDWPVAVLGYAALAGGVLSFGTNLLLVVHRHGPDSWLRDAFSSEQFGIGP